MMKPNHVTTGFLIFIVFITLFTGVYKVFEDKYDITRDGTSCPKIGSTTLTNCTGETKSIGEALSDTTTISGITGVTDAIQSFSTPGSVLEQSYEVLTGAGLGIIKIFLGLVYFPGQVVSIILQYYQLPSYQANLLAVILNVYIIFIMLRYILKQE